MHACRRRIILFLGFLACSVTLISLLGGTMASFETRVTEIRADPRGGFSVMLKPHFLERDVAYQKVWLEPHFDNHCASIAEDSIEVRTENAPPVYVGQIVTVYAVEPEHPTF